MALTACRECGADVSTDAAACPSCGKVRTTRNTKVLTVAFVVVVLLVAFLFVA